MQQCNETITVVNAKFNQQADKDEYHATVINGVSWSLIVSIITISFYLAGNAFSDASDPRNHV